MIKLVIFDLDGTLINTIEDLGAACDYALGLRNLKGHSVEDYTDMVGHGVRRLVQLALEKSMGRGVEDSLVDEVLADFTRYYVEHIDVNTRPYPGMVEILKRLDKKGVRLAVASNKFQEGVELLVREFFPEVSFVAVLGNKVGLPLKPDAGVVELALKNAGVSRADCVLVGDSGTDIRTAKNAGVRCIGVTWGFRPERDLVEAGADRIAHSSAELAEMLEAGC